MTVASSIPFSNERAFMQGCSLWMATLRRWQKSVRWRKNTTLWCLWTTATRLGFWGARDAAQMSTAAWSAKWTSSTPLSARPWEVPQVGTHAALQASSHQRRGPVGRAQGVQAQQTKCGSCHVVGRLIAGPYRSYQLISP